MALVYLALGSNLGHQLKNLNDAVIAISLEAGNVLSLSDLMQSSPQGFISGNQFLNGVLLLETELSPLRLLEKLKEIEKRMGRTANKTNVYEDRIIDIDILLYDNQIINLPELKIPHPKMTERDFVLIPLTEIAPGMIHPVTGQKLIDLIKNQI